MRRVIDDNKYELAARQIMESIETINPKDVSKYDYGTRRAQISLIVEYITSRLKDYMLLVRPCTYGIGNNQVREIVYAPKKCSEEQICGFLHLTDNMFGSVICYCTDYDGNKKTKSIIIRGE